MSQLITADLVDVDLFADTKEAAARSLAERMTAAGRVTDLEAFLADVAAREAQMPTGLDGGIGIPHCRSAHVTEPTLAFGRSAEGIDFGAPDGPADLIFLIAAPAGADDDHLTILSALARRLADSTFTEALRAERDPARAAALIRGETPPEAGADADTEEPGEQPDTAPAGSGPAPFRIVAVTSCPTGIAHTYMAAEALQRAGEEEGVDLRVETQGSAGFRRIDPAVVAAADAVILAHDVEVREKARFAGKPVVDVGVKAAINRPAALIAEAREKAAQAGAGATAEAAPKAPDTAGRAPMDEGAEGDGFGTRLRTWLMTGVSYMVPFVAAGGLLIALAFALGGYKIGDAPSVAEHFAWGEAASWAALMFQTGQAAFGFLVPVLAGFVAYGMADRPGLVPGFVGGAIAVTVDAGFLGGLVAGLLAGAVVAAIQRLTIPPVLRGIMPVVVIPLVSSAVVGFLMFVVVGGPIASFQKAMTDWLGGLSGTNAVLLGVLLGLMMCFDLGGPVNKVAYAFAVGGLATPTDGSLKVMAAVMAAGMVPPLGMALATTVRARLFGKAERENGKAAWVLGASFISEGAIPFAAADPLRVIPSAMAGGAVTGALSMAFGATLRAPHGGLFVVPLIGNALLYVVAIAAGTVVTAALVVLLKSRRTVEPAPAASDTPAGEPVSA
ncbi:PTS fructose transporter subunit IIABC [Streptomyces albidoflavus]|uniref:PTS fructose transporter subunit IIABC n=1 Tax=Streptomyces TaxID=1883 RepID=UPI00081E36C5|nr:MULTISPECIES: fructose-specific PTS transporter subunit EIIC [Streptomyces]SCD45295.1 PTS system D-fructose-specific IIA component (F1P-forming), Frc family /PTS system D-fructose-specific IIB component (F1P-forming), Frc family /PTS system D-fructose-specific IIC component (F1P-forming), Frc family [Streptomyces sp. IgraMP-1]RZE29895.1 PTS lactose transporter subunit IIC [Streptomyces albidoflavus]RZE53490.1 PTS lactose transporter subunit IIC [Streptomyces albidoflavus]WJK65136.1 fructose-